MTSRAKALVLALQVVLGCGGRAAGPRDGGPDAPPLTGLRAFEVTAFLSPANDGGPVLGAFPITNTFTLVLDVEEGRAIAGGTGRGAVVPVSTTDGRTFVSSGRFPVGIPASNGCSGPTEVRYDSFEVTVTGTTLHGTARGAVQVSCGDCIFDEPFTATLTGVSDAKAPFLLGSATVATPFDGFAVLASEPLPATAKAQLVASDGSTVELEPSLTDGTPPLIVAFHKPDVVLRPGQGYSVAADGLVDFAGHAGTADAPLRLTSFKAAPLVPEDGFESAVGATVGGANLIRGGGPLAPITGTASAYVGSASSPKAGSVAPSPSLNVSLALQPVDRKLRFAYRFVSTQGGSPFGISVHLGSVGRTPSAYNQLPPIPEGAQEDWPGGPVFVSAVLTAELDLPTDAQGELVVSIAAVDGGCGLFLSSAAVLIDDLRVE